ncbi:FAS-associated death domain protein [Gasterosteus aculeatus]|uniref:Fas (tnfrsf6)-associated via death domain n=1 Tax=Gasterosteus aculeatus aculeatus TaxID=481459 RepID=A0AAQ4PYR9_GASAC|nr:protein FADD [Gasterosteus aculeatus aculeatus]
MSSFQFNKLLLDISNQLTEDQLSKMKFLVRDLVGKRELEKITSGTLLFQVLTERRQLGSEQTEFLSKLLRDIDRSDLSDKLDNFENGSAPCDDQPDPSERDKLDSATDVIAGNLGKPWRRLGRRLGLSDVKLESVSTRHTDLEETAREMLKEWRKSRGAAARAAELVEALRRCDFNLTADKVEDALSTP